MERRHPRSLCLEVMALRLRRLHERKAPGDTIGEVDVLLVRVAGEQLIEALVLEDSPPEGHEIADEAIRLADADGGGDPLDPEPGAQPARSLGPPSTNPKEPSPHLGH